MDRHRILKKFQGNCREKRNFDKSRLPLFHGFTEWHWRPAPTSKTWLTETLLKEIGLDMKLESRRSSYHRWHKRNKETSRQFTTEHFRMQPLEYMRGGPHKVGWGKRCGRFAHGIHFTEMELGSSWLGPGPGVAHCQFSSQHEVIFRRLRWCPTEC